MSKNIMQAIAMQEDRFLKLDGANGKLLDFRQECLFAQQQIMKNTYTAGVAQENLNSLKAAIMNVAAIGISLNPALQHAYLVPRDKKICLDISFRGLVKLATESGAITWAKAELVFEKDTFAYRGPSTAPTHEADVFGDRGALKGGYVIAKLPDGEVLIDVMSVAEIHKVRDTSKAKNNGPWVDWYHEMCKKTLIKRAYKSWPQTEGRVRLDRAVATLNETEGMAYTIDQHAEYLRLIRAGDAIGLYVFSRGLSVDESSALFNSFEAGAKTADKARVRELVAAGAEEFNATVDRLIELAQGDQDMGIAEIMETLSVPVRHALEGAMPAELARVVTEAAPSAVEP